MSDIPTFSLDGLDHESSDDTQAKLLHNALRNFCDNVESDEHTKDEDKKVTIRKVVWKYGPYRFRGELVTFDGQTSIGQFDFTESSGDDWNRLANPRALAEKLTEARELKQK